MQTVILLSLAPIVLSRDYARGFVRQPRNAVVEVATITEADRNSAPDVVDWTAKGAHTAVKDQGVCGSCWAFSATEGIESAVFMATGSAPELSAQQIISCDEKDAAGCDGGDLPSAFDYVMAAGGIASEQAYPETSMNTGDSGTCKAVQSKVTTVTSYKYAVPPCDGGECASQDEDGLAAALAKFGPISICVNSGDSHWEFYEGGMWPPASHPNCKSDWDLIDHCVQLVGYDKTASPPYWKVRNSWGTQWGEAGFIRLPMGQNACGLADEAIIVSVESTVSV
jgi:C1A family cysteine protease